MVHMNLEKINLNDIELLALKYPSNPRIGIWKSCLTISYAEKISTYAALWNERTSVPEILHAVTITGSQERYRMDRRNLNHYRIGDVDIEE